MANNNSMVDESPSKKPRADDDSSLPTLVSIDYLRVNKVDLDIGGNGGKQIKQIYRFEEDRSETEDEDRKIIDDESDDDEDEDDDEEDEEELLVYGTVIVKDCWGDDIVFHQYPYFLCEYSLRLPLPLPLPLQISLQGPTRAISGDGNFIIGVSLWGLLRKGYLSRKGIIKEIAIGEMVWDPYKQDKLSYNKPLQLDVSGKHGSVSVGYSVIQRALSATIDVVWMNKTKSEGQIYGTIKAIRLLQGSPTTPMPRMLFEISADKCYDVNPGESLFPSRFSGLETSPFPYDCLDTFPFPVQMRSLLTIEVDLRDHLSPDGQSVLGEVQFTTEFGTQTKYITGKYSEVKVSMTCELPCPEQ